MNIEIKRDMSDCPRGWAGCRPLHVIKTESEGFCCTGVAYEYAAACRTCVKESELDEEWNTDLTMVSAEAHYQRRLNRRPLWESLKDMFKR